MTFEQLPDCKSKLWYVTDCEIKGVVGICAKTLEELKLRARLAVLEIAPLNNVPASIVDKVMQGIH